jgi:hypothetical protein
VLLTASNLTAACDEGTVTLTRSAPTYCNCRLAEGEKPYLANYRDCGHAKEMQKKSQRTPRTTTGRVFSSNLTTPGVSGVYEPLLTILQLKLRRKYRISFPSTKLISLLI